MRGKKRLQERLVKGPLVLYEQMRRKVLELIEERGIKPHNPVPSEGELVEMFGVSRRTSKQALELLAKEGIVYRMPRRGTFLADPNQLPDGSGTRQPVMKQVAIVVPELDEFVGQVVSSAIRHAQERQMELLLRITRGSHEQEEEAVKELAASPRIAESIFLRYSTTT